MPQNPSTRLLDSVAAIAAGFPKILRGLRRWFALWLLLLLVVWLLIACQDGQQRKKVFLVGFDGLSTEVLDGLLAKGECPNFAKLRRRGVTLQVTSFGAMLSPVIWTTVITGKMPEKHGITDFFQQRSAKGKMFFQVSSHNRRVKALWNIAPERGLRVGVVNWWASYPCEDIDGIMVSKNFAEGFAKLGVKSPESVCPETFRQRIDWIPDQVGREYDKLADLHNLAYPAESRTHLLQDETVFRVFERMYLEAGLQVFAVYFWQLDQMEHIYFHAYDRSPVHGDDRVQKRRKRVLRYSPRILTDYYRYYDSLLGRIMRYMDKNSLLVLVSDHGFGIRETDGVPWHKQDTYGFLYTPGTFLVPGQTMTDVKMTDYLPTILLYLGLPQADDMDGQALRQAFTTDFLADCCKQKIDSYDNGFVVPHKDVPNPIQKDQLKNLKTLGYIK